MSALGPLGALLRLPREIRDEIYSYCFGKKYQVFWFYPDYNARHGFTILSVLRVSKAISSEAKDILFSKAASKATVFKYDIMVYPDEKIPNPPTKQATQRMMNVEFKVDSFYPNEEEDDYVDGDLDSNMDLLCEATVDRFAGTAISRDTFRITFDTDFDGFDHDFPVFMKTRFFQTFKKFNGFQKVTFVILLRHDLRNARKPTPSKDLEEMRMHLEPHLGPSVTRSVTQAQNIRYWFHGDTILELEFKPRRFHVESLRAESARLTIEADRLEG